jgi:Mn2+/Fe2+ NRAMP family transporter
MRETGRTGPEHLKTSRLDLLVAYGMTAIFGVSMVIIGSRLQLDGKGANLLVELANQLQEPLGTAGRWIFLLGAFGAVFSSLMGVWQAVPYLFADVVRLLGDSDEEVSTTSRAYRRFLIALATVPALGLVVPFEQVQKLYAIIGAAFVPLLAIGLLLMNTREKLIGAELKNRALATVALVATLGFFTWAAVMRFTA